MKLADLSAGPDWVVYVGFIIFAVLSVVLISGHGSWLISGYNTASKEEKAKYNEKKLCNNGIWNVCYRNSCSNYGVIGKYFTCIFCIYCIGDYFG